MGSLPASKISSFNIFEERSIKRLLILVSTFDEGNIQIYVWFIDPL